MLQTPMKMEWEEESKLKTENSDKNIKLFDCLQ